MTDFNDIAAIVEEAQVLRLALFDEKYPYILPVNYGYQWQEKQLTFYLHGATVGKKIDCITANNHVCVEIDIDHHLIDGGQTAAHYSYGYKSLIGYGTATIVEDLTEKKHALEKLMAHAAKDHSFDAIPEAMIKRTGVIKVELTSYTAKANIPMEK
ncbi:nitroimidazol reductase NimA-like FMN-containing flavoprotein (pyridoxamine 5'-phosphate oxidase superfamily) [Enterococcus sp. PF1-24]|uniref:pyridoxamine 5'-phosphate oxidase family protein n=1 Tax=unclassified Enterococcus TaxID=2608891 RepID=UPI002476316B|nr:MULTISPECIES: pyridoxamine 5'-phosphate oxidase family protein [unclassified Enterococcus]MDH6365120.1 nitroimidazol reductase NimA-like FMN-containing flavoprotein (pyridoxamine 5'-phosphate oxidase superfamily) [Enterococcus sp. PFB1-1]MDH6402221.1 nitroimidazol reductase NimA-like FMN-containing flavoprotein (pyridoxamine 5'-phosphate oxidase superfamily) [Enterococcus sp. PF1-24]